MLSSKLESIGSSVPMSWLCERCTVTGSPALLTSAAVAVPRGVPREHQRRRSRGDQFRLLFIDSPLQFVSFRR